MRVENQIFCPDQTIKSQNTQKYYVSEQKNLEEDKWNTKERKTIGK